MKIHTLRDLFIDQLRDLYNAENQLVKALPKMAKSAAHGDLQTAFEQHLEQTKNHVNRLEGIFERFGVTGKGKKCKAMEGLIEEGKEVTEIDAEDDILDAALIAAAQRVEHYEIAGYGCARTFAELLGEREAANTLQQTLDEEKETDNKLTQLAMSHINRDAAGGDFRGDGAGSTRPVESFAAG